MLLLLFKALIDPVTHLSTGVMFCLFFNQRQIYPGRGVFFLLPLLTFFSFFAYTSFSFSSCINNCSTLYLFCCLVLWRCLVKGVPDVVKMGRKGFAVGRKPLLAMMFYIYVCRTWYDETFKQWKTIDEHWTRKKKHANTKFHLRLLFFKTQDTE